MEDDPLLEAPIAIEDLANALTIVLIEVVAAVLPVSKDADQALDDIASGLLTAQSEIASSTIKSLLSSLARNLIQTEAGAME